MPGQTENTKIAFFSLKWFIETQFVMAALCNTAAHYIFVLWFLILSSFFLLSFFLVYSQPSHIACLPYFHTGCRLNANLECRSQMCCTWLAENTVGLRTKSPKIRHMRTISYNFVGLYLLNLGTYRQSEKLVKQQYLLEMSPQYDEIRPASG